MEITKIKLAENRERLVIHWEEYADGLLNKYTLDCGEQPLPGLLESLTALLDLVINVCYLDESAWVAASTKDNAFVSGLSLKYCEEGFGVNITAQFRDEGEPEDGGTRVVVINTPYLKPETLRPQDDRLIRKAIDQAEAYIRGDRKLKQLSLLDQPEPALAGVN